MPVGAATQPGKQPGRFSAWHADGFRVKGVRPAHWYAALVAARPLTMFCFWVLLLPCMSLALFLAPTSTNPTVPGAFSPSSNFELDLAKFELQGSSNEAIVSLRATLNKFVAPNAAGVDPRLGPNIPFTPGATDPTNFDDDLEFLLDPAESGAPQPYAAPDCSTGERSARRRRVLQEMGQHRTTSPPNMGATLRVTMFVDQDGDGRPDSGSNMLAADETGARPFLERALRLEQRLRLQPWYRDLCYAPGAGNTAGCMAPDSFLTWAFPSVDPHWPRPVYNGGLPSVPSPGSIAPASGASDTTPSSGDDSIACLANYLVSAFGPGHVGYFSREFGTWQGEEEPHSSTSVLVGWHYLDLGVTSEAIAAIVPKLLDFKRSAGSDEPDLSAGGVPSPGLGMTFATVHDRLVREPEAMAETLFSAKLCTISFVVVFLYMLAALRSSFLAVTGVLETLAVFPATWLIVNGLGWVRVITTIDLLSLFVLIGVGVDDVFVLASTFELLKPTPWARDSGVPHDVHLWADRAHRLEHAFRHAFASMFVTTFTTAGSFYANMFNEVDVVASFGAWMGTLVAVNFVFVCTIYGAALSVWDAHMRGARVCCCSRPDSPIVVLADAIENTIRRGSVSMKRRVSMLSAARRTSATAPAPGGADSSTGTGARGGNPQGPVDDAGNASAPPHDRAGPSANGGQFHRRLSSILELSKATTRTGHASRDTVGSTEVYRHNPLSPRGAAGSVKSPTSASSGAPRGTAALRVSPRRRARSGHRDSASTRASSLAASGRLTGFAALLLMHRETQRRRLMSRLEASGDDVEVARNLEISTAPVVSRPLRMFFDGIWFGKGMVVMGTLALLAFAGTWVQTLQASDSTPLVLVREANYNVEPELAASTMVKDCLAGESDTKTDWGLPSRCRMGLYPTMGLVLYTQPGAVPETFNDLWGLGKFPPRLPIGTAPLYEWCPADPSLNDEIIPLATDRARKVFDAALCTFPPSCATGPSGPGSSASSGSGASEGSGGSAGAGAGSGSSSGTGAGSASGGTEPSQGSGGTAGNGGTRGATVAPAEAPIRGTGLSALPSFGDLDDLLPGEPVVVCPRNPCPDSGDPSTCRLPRTLARRDAQRITIGFGLVGKLKYPLDPSLHSQFPAAAYSDSPSTLAMQAAQAAPYPCNRGAPGYANAPVVQLPAYSSDFGIGKALRDMVELCDWLVFNNLVLPEEALGQDCWPRSFQQWLGADVNVDERDMTRSLLEWVGVKSDASLDPPATYAALRSNFGVDITASRVLWAQITFPSTTPAALSKQQSFACIDMWTADCPEDLTLVDQSRACGRIALFQRSRNEANPALQGAWATAGTAWQLLVIEVAFRDGTIKAVVFSVGCALAAAAVFTGSIRLALLVASTVAAILLCVVAFLSMIGFKFGVVESIAIVVLCGISVDFVLHLSHAFVMSPYTFPRARMRHAVELMGSSIISSAMTTGISALPLVFATLDPLRTFGIVYVFTIAFSAMFSLFAFTLAGAAWGPQRKRVVGSDPDGGKARDHGIWGMIKSAVAGVVILCKRKRRGTDSAVELHAASGAVVEWSVRARDARRGSFVARSVHTSLSTASLVVKPVSAADGAGGRGAAAASGGEIASSAEAAVDDSAAASGKPGSHNIRPRATSDLPSVRRFSSASSTGASSRGAAALASVGSYVLRDDGACSVAVVTRTEASDREAIAPAPATGPMAWQRCDPPQLATLPGAHAVASLGMAMLVASDGLAPDIPRLNLFAALRRLDLSCNQLGEDKLQRANLGSLPHLMWLSVAHNIIESAAQLGSLVGGLRSLQYLWCDGNPCFPEVSMADMAAVAGVTLPSASAATTSEPRMLLDSAAVAAASEAARRGAGTDHHASEDLHGVQKRARRALFGAIRAATVPGFALRVLNGVPVGVRERVESHKGRTAYLNALEALRTDLTLEHFGLVVPAPGATGPGGKRRSVRVGDADIDATDMDGGGQAAGSGAVKARFSGSTLSLPRCDLAFVGHLAQVGSPRFTLAGARSESKTEASGTARATPTRQPRTGPFGAISVLCLAHNAIGALGVQNLYELPALRVLDVRWCHLVSAEDLIVGLSGCHALRALYLEGNPIVAAGSGKGNEGWLHLLYDELFTHLRAVDVIDGHTNPNPLSARQLRAAQTLNSIAGSGRGASANNVLSFDLASSGIATVQAFHRALAALAVLGTVEDVYLSDNGFTKALPQYRHYVVARLRNHIKSVDGLAVSSDQIASAVVYCVDPKRRDWRHRLLQAGDKDADMDEMAESDGGRLVGAGVDATMRRAARAQRLVTAAMPRATTTVLGKVELVFAFLQTYGFILRVQTNVAIPYIDLKWPGPWVGWNDVFGWLPSFAFTFSLGDILEGVSQRQWFYARLLAMIFMPGVLLLAFREVSSMTAEVWRAKYIENWRDTAASATGLVLQGLIVAAIAGFGYNVVNADGSVDTAPTVSVVDEESDPELVEVAATDQTTHLTGIQGTGALLVSGIMASMVLLAAGIWLAIVMLFRRKAIAHDLTSTDFVTFWARLKRLSQRAVLFLISVSFMPIAKELTFLFSREYNTERLLEPGLRAAYANVSDAAQVPDTAFACPWYDDDAFRCCTSAFRSSPCVGTAAFKSSGGGFVLEQWFLMPFALIYGIGIPALFVRLIRSGTREIEHAGFQVDKERLQPRIDATTQELRRVGGLRFFLLVKAGAWPVLSHPKVWPRVHGPLKLTADGHEIASKLAALTDELQDAWADAVMSNYRAQTYLYQPYGHNRRYHRVIQLGQKVLLLVVAGFTPIGVTNWAAANAAGAVLWLNVIGDVVLSPFSDAADGAANAVFGFVNAINLVASQGLAPPDPNGATAAFLVLINVFALCVAVALIVGAVRQRRTATRLARAEEEGPKDGATVVSNPVAAIPVDAGTAGGGKGVTSRDGSKATPPV